METVNLNIAHRWFTGYDLDETVPDHSSLSKIRERYGMEIFQQFFEKIVELCVDAGLVWGEELYFDSTKVDANASINSMIDRTESKAEQHLEKLWENNGKSTPPDLTKQNEYYSPNMFQYDAENDQYTCPQKHKLTLYSRRKSEKKFIYRAKAKVCDACPVKAQCTGSKSG